MKIEEFLNKTKLISNTLHEICENPYEYNVDFRINTTKYSQDHTTKSYYKFISCICKSFTELIENITSIDMDQDVKNLVINLINTGDCTFKESFYDDFTVIEGRLHKECDNIDISIIIAYTLA